MHRKRELRAKIARLRRKLEVATDHVGSLLQVLNRLETEGVIPDEILKTMPVTKATEFLNPQKKD